MPVLRSTLAGKIRCVSAKRPPTDSESIRRRRVSMDEAKAILGFAGGALSAEGEQLAEKVVAGELTTDEAVAELLRKHS